MEQCVKDLIDEAVEMHNNLITEFGENDYRTNKLKNAIMRCGAIAVLYENEKLKVMLP